MRVIGNDAWDETKDLDGAHVIVPRAIELGVDLIDAADSYVLETSERILGMRSTLPRGTVNGNQGASALVPDPVFGFRSACRNTCTSRSS